MKSILDRARAYLAKMPVSVSGQGGHDAAFAAALVLVKGFALGEQEAFSLLDQWNDGCLPPWNESELRHKLKDAAASSKPAGYLIGKSAAPHRERAHRLTTAKHHHTPPRVTDNTFDGDKLARIAAGLPEANAQWFKQRSPRPPESMCVETFLQAITVPEEHLICFTDLETQGQLVWKNFGVPPPTHREFSKWRHGLEKGAWFLPQPVTGEYLFLERAKTKYNPDGRTRRSQENVTSFRFAVVESDEADTAHWLSVLAQLPLPIVSIVTSGGDSIHALILVNAPTKPAWDAIVRDRLLRPLKIIGADHGPLMAMGITRLPFIHRGGVLQELLYLNTAPTTQPIANLQPRLSNDYLD